jgi:hypothetical protein
MFCICFIIIIDLIFIDFRFIHFCLEICQWHLDVRFLPPISYVPMIAVFKTISSQIGLKKKVKSAPKNKNKKM